MLKEKFQLPILIHKYDVHMLDNSGKKLLDSWALKVFHRKQTLYLVIKNWKFGEIALKTLHTPVIITMHF